MSRITLCLVQDDSNEKFYRFKNTNIKVYSFEEALYHCYHYWKYSLDEYFLDDFINWVENDLGLINIAQKIKLLKNTQKNDQMILELLQISNYFDKSYIDNLREEFKNWILMDNIAKSKEIADFVFNIGNYKLALEYYFDIIKYDENYKILNNIGLCYLKLDMFYEANNFFKVVYIKNSKQQEVLYNYILTSIYLKKSEEYEILFEKFLTIGSITDILYIKAIHCFFYEEYYNCVYNLIELIKLKKTDNILLILVEALIRSSNYNKAFEYLMEIRSKSYEYYKKLLLISKKINRYEFLIDNLQNTDDHNLLIILACVYKEKGELENSIKIIDYVLKLDPKNVYAMYTKSLIKKDLGEMKTYQILLDKIIDELKIDYLYK